jgi:phospholipid N-methyltransferase
MERLIGHVDTAAETRVAGWAADEGDLSRQVYVDVFLNSVRIASVRAALYREDLLRAGIGDGCKGFAFDFSGYLSRGFNALEVRHASSGAPLEGGQARVLDASGDVLNLDAATRERLLSISQERWKGDEDDTHLTWGAILTGDSFLDALERQYRFSPEHHICEIGPGYGRLLKTILERKLPFRRYTGVELSAARAAKLTQRFGSDAIEFLHADAIEFLHADAMTVRLAEKADLLISSATFEHLFPDFRQAVRNMAEHNLHPGAGVAIDFIQQDAAMEHRAQVFEHGRVFVRTYAAEEIRGLLEECGMRGVRLESIVLGQGLAGDVRRILAFAAAPGVAAAGGR